MDDKQKAPTRRLFDSGFGGSQRTQETPHNYSNRPRDESTQERLEFDLDSGKLVVSNAPEVKQEVVSVHHVPVSFPQVPASVTDRPVVDAMAAQGFFLY